MSPPNTSSPASKSANEREPRLFGIDQSNRQHADMWGKNCFNSAFPTALACYMRSKNIKPVYVCLEEKNGNFVCVNNEISVDDVFNVSPNIRNQDLYFCFEAKFNPYLDYVRDKAQLDSADLVIKHNNEWLRAMQIKLTVVPDSGTSAKSKEEWGPEIVFRPADTCSCALGIFATVADRAEEVAEHFRIPCSHIQDWNNTAEISHNRDNLLDCVEKFLTIYHKQQIPYLLQQIWMTEGQSPILANNAFDIFIWSDYALIAAYLRQAQMEAGMHQGKLHRGTRAVARFARMQYELASSRNHKIDILSISRRMDFGAQTDKEVAFSGNKMCDYMTSPRRVKPILPPHVLKKIILNNGHKMLSPERRFDQTVYFMANQYFKA